MHTIDLQFAFEKKKSLPRTSLLLSTLRDEQCRYFEDLEPMRQISIKKKKRKEYFIKSLIMIMIEYYWQIQR